MPSLRSSLRVGLHRALLRDAIGSALAHFTSLERGLDLGCGEGPYHELFATVCRSVIAYDIRRHVGVGVVGAAAALPFRSATFDLVLSTQVLEHVADPAMAVKEIARVLVPCGAVILTVPQMVALHEAPHDYFRYTEFGIRHLLTKYGFKGIVVRPLGGFWTMLAQQLEFRLLWDHAPRSRMFRQVQLVLGRLLVAGLAAIDGSRPEGRYALNHLASGYLGRS